MDKKADQIGYHEPFTGYILKAEPRFLGVPKRKEGLKQSQSIIIVLAFSTHLKISFFAYLET